MSIYTYNGAEFSEEDVIAKAKEKGMDLDSYINKFGIEKSDAEGPGKKKPAVVKDVAVAGKKNTASKLEPSSLGSQSKPFGRVKLFDQNEASPKPKKFNPSLSDTSIDFSALDNRKSKSTKAPKTGLGSSSVMWRASNQKAIDKKAAEQDALAKKQEDLNKTFPAREKIAKDEISFNNPNKVLKYDLEGDSQVEVVQNLNKKLNRLGISVEQNTFDNKLRFSQLSAPNRQIEGAASSLTPTISYSNEGVSIDPNNDKDINEYISKFGNVNYLDDVKKRVSKINPNYISKITPPSLPNDKKIQGARASLIEGFKNLEKNNTKELTDSYGTVTRIAADLEKNDFNSPEEYALYKEWKKNPNALLNIPTSKVDAWDKVRREEFVKTATRNLSLDLPDSARRDLAILSQEAINENKRTIQSFKLAGEKLNERSRNYKKNYDAFTKNPTPEGQILLKEEYLSLVNEQNNLQSWQKDLAQETNTINEVMGPAIQNFGANYSRLSQLATGFKKTAADVALAFDDIAAYGSAAILGKTQDEVMKADTLGISYMAKELAKKQQEYQSSVGVDEIRSFRDAGNWLMGGVVNNVPSIAMAFTGPAAMPLFFASGYGGKANQMQIEVDSAKMRLSENYNALNFAENEFEKGIIEGQIKADEEMLNLPEYKKLAAKTIYGSAEVAFEALGTLAILKGLGDATKMLPKKSLSDGLLWAGGTATKNFNREGLSEFATTTTGNFTDVYVLGENKNMFEGGLESYAQGGVFGVGFGINQSAKVIKRAYVSELATKVQAKRIQEITNQISELTNTPAYKFNQGIPLPAQTPAVQKLVNELIAESGDIENRVIGRIGSDLTIEQAKQIGDINRQIREVNKDFLEATQSGEANPEQLKALEKHYRGRFNELVQERESLLTDQNLIKEGERLNRDAQFEFDLTEGYSSYDSVMRETSIAKVINNFDNLDSGSKQTLLEEAKAKLEAEKIGDISEKSIEDKAKKDFVDKYYSDAIKKGITNSLQFAKTHGLNMDIELFEDDSNQESADKRIIDAYSQADGITKTKIINFSNAIKRGEVEGANITVNGKPKALIYLKGAVQNRRTGVGSHEVLHTAVKKAFNDQAGIDKAGADLLGYLEKYDPNLYALVTARIDSSYGKKDKSGIVNLRDENGEIIKDENYYEEAMNALSDLAADGVELPVDALNAVKNFINKVLPSFMPKFKDNEGANVYQFIKDYNKEAHFGKKKAANLINFSNRLTGGDQEEKEKFSSTKVKEVEQKIEKLEDQFEKDEIEYDDYTSRLEAFEKELEKAKAMPEVESKPKVEKQKAETTEEDEVKEIIKENKSSVASDKVQKIYETKGKEGAQDIINLFKPITKKIVDKRRDAPDFDRELLTDEIETGVGGILDLITKYNPELGTPLAAYINKYLPMRAIATSKRLLGKEFSKDVTEEKALIAEETVAEVKEKPKYANALESNLFESDVLKTITNKILTQIRTLKSRIDAPISINRTVTPLITEIKDAVGKQLDIDVKTAMGGKKDEQLKKWMLKNKRYVLENMTTTWLMGLDGKGGIPQAIQKQIDGKWVNYPDWVGQKIDRESVSTDNAGRTSGAELVRRIPNVFNNVSDADYLAQVIGPDGNPIRGRKESLAKAIAEEASFDIVLDDFENQGPIFDAFITNQERLGVEIDDVLTTAFANQVERGNVKFSKSAVTNSMLFLLKENNWDFNSKELADFKNSLDDKDQRYYADFRKKWIRRVANLLDEYKRIWESNAGVKFEAEAFNKLRKFSKNNSDFILNEAAPDRFNSRNPDLVYRVGKDGRNVIVELKADKTAPHGSTSNTNLLGDEIIFTKGFDGDTEMKSKMEDNESRQKALEYLKSNNLSKDGNSLIVSNEVWNNVKGEKTGPSMAITPKTLAQINVGKDIIHIQGNGSFTYEGSNTGELSKVPLISGNMYVYSRITSVASGKNRRIIERLFFQLGNNWDQKSDYDLIDNPSEFVNDSTKFSKTISPRFNKIIEENKGVEDYKNFSDIVARRRGAGKNILDIYVPASAADFELLLYNFIGKGAKGEEQKKFFTDTLLKPYANGSDLMDAARQSIKNEYKQLLSDFPDVAKKIEKRTPDGDFTYDQAIRVAMWNEEGAEIPGLSQRDSNKLTDLVNNDPELKAFKDALIVTGRQGRGWVKPEQYWDANTIITDLHNLTEGEGRKKFLSEFIANAEEMFGKFENGKLVGPNINKVEAVYGTDVREALEDVLYRMTTGKNKSFGKDKETSNWANWVSGSTGAIMFLNVRSAALQLIGAVNFLNLRDNNPYAAAKAFANQKQYWEDFARIWNSDKMKERRGGLKEDVAAAEIANAAAGSKNKVGAVLSYLLKIGYTPTQMADSFAIASGGAPFYRNRIKSYLKEGMTEQDAENAAWDDFTKVSDETQQSGDPRDISKQQASPAGRLLLTFQNTAMQQSRIVKKAFLDLKNGRGDAKTNFAKIAYYVAIQNTMFAVLQQGLFAVAFGYDDEDDEIEYDAEGKKITKKEKELNEKLFDVADGVIDTILRGTGFMGGIVATVKNMAKKYLDERDKKFKADYAKVVLEGANLSPPIGSKLRKLYSGLQQTKFDKDLIDARGWDVMQDGRVNVGPMYSVTGKVVEAFTNVPMDRLVTKVNNASEAMNSQNTTMQRIMVGLGWSPYSAGIEDSPGDKKIREEAKAKRKIEGVEKAKETRERTKDSIRQLPVSEQLRLRKEAALERREKRRRRKMG
jgi:hypothetical protein